MCAPNKALSEAGWWIARLDALCKEMPTRCPTTARKGAQLSTRVLVAAGLLLVGGVIFLLLRRRRVRPRDLRD